VVDHKIARRLGWIGLVVPILLVVSFFTGKSLDSHWNVSGQAVLDFYNQHQTGQLANFYLFGALLIWLVFFGAVLAYTLHALTEQRILPLVAFAGGVIVFATGCISGMAQLGLIVGAPRGLSPGTAQMLALLNTRVDPIGMQVGALLVTAGVACTLLAVHRKSWLGWLSLVIGALCALHPAALALFVLWVPIAGFVLARRLPAGTPAIVHD
jgi:hypothetical protein